MQPVKILTPSFLFLGEIDNYESLQFTRRFNTIGEFEMHINLNKNYSDTLQEDNLLMLSASKVGVIRHREVSHVNEDQLIIKGYTLQGILSRRITMPLAGESHDAIKGETETVMKHYVQNNAVNPTDSTRKIPQLLIADDKKRGPIVDWQSRYKQLEEELESLSPDGIGWEVYLDFEKEKFVFDMAISKNLTAGQSELPPVIFSIDFDNIQSLKLTDSASNYKNTAYVAGQGEGAERAIAEVGINASGLDRIETFVDARDIEDSSKLPDRGLEKLSEAQKILSFESEILSDGPFEYEKDWDLGDIVTVQDKKLGLTMDTPIPEVREIYEVGGFRLEVTFGNTIPTLTDKIKQATKTPMLESGPIPTKTSELENDTGYVTKEDVPIGPPGPKGDVGPIGPQGPKGEIGPKGDTGLTGATGPKGDTGSQGIQGQKGDTGEKGPIGLTGSQGPKGDKGDTGSTGQQGLQGDPGATWLSGSGTPAASIGANNDYYLNTSNSDIFKKISGVWSAICNIRGLQGIQGLKGDPGATGAQGQKGDKGDQGQQGLQGLKGDTGETGAKGDTGLQGTKGDTGQQGPKGDVGPQGPKGDKGGQIITSATAPTNPVAGDYWYKEV